MATFLSLAGLVVQRAVAAPSLALFRLLGALIAVALVCGVSIYSATMGDTMLQANLNSGDDLINVTAAPPAGQPATLSGYAELDSYLRRHAAGDLQLPVRSVQTHHHSVTMPVYRWQAAVDLSTQPLGTADFEFYDGFARQVHIVAGRFPAFGQTGGGAIAV